MTVKVVFFRAGLLLLASSMMSIGSAQRGSVVMRREGQSLSFQTAYDESIRFAERPDLSASSDLYQHNRGAVSKRRALKSNQLANQKLMNLMDKGKRKTQSPTYAPTITMLPTMAPTTENSNTMEVKFFQLPASQVVFVNSTSPDPQAIGTVFVYSDMLYDADTLTQVNKTFVSGTCTRTQQREDQSNGEFVVGSGHCLLTYTLVDENNNTSTFNAAGEVFDLFGGLLAVQGGTSLLLGAYGEIQLSPVTVTNSSTTPFDGDFFTGPTGYEVNVTLSLINANFTTSFA